MTTAERDETCDETLLPTALAYAAAGVPVMPLFAPLFGPDKPARCSCGHADCRRPGKHPRNRGGLTGASTDPAVITAWWEHWPGANLGGRTGIVFDVCDVDGPEGAAAVARLLTADHRRGEAPLTRTGSGGWHLLFAPTGLGNRVGFLPSVDWRGQGGYVVLPPSRHISGNHYATVRPLTAALPPVPPALLATLTQTSGKPARSPHSAPAGRSRGYGPAALDREAGAVRAATEGRRNDALNRAAFNLGQLIAASQLTAGEVEAELTDAALAAGLTPAEIARTITSGLMAGQQHPRTRRTPQEVT
jgi:hypothetical protein